MCDYSLNLVASRPARVGDKLVTTRRASASPTGEQRPFNDFTQMRLGDLVAIHRTCKATICSSISSRSAISRFTAVSGLDSEGRTFASCHL